MGGPRGTLALAEFCHRFGRLTPSERPDILTRLRTRLSGFAKTGFVLWRAQLAGAEAGPLFGKLSYQNHGRIDPRRGLEGLCRAGSAVDRLSLEIRDRELLVLVGPSGCGKSTTLRLVAGLDRPSAGRVLIAGREVGDVPAWRRNVAMVFQQPALYPHIDVRRNMAFGLAAREKRSGNGNVPAPPQAAVDPPGGLLPETSPMDERLRRVAGWLGIEALLARRPSELSGGERQRVALGRAILRRPDVFLLDEPLSNLDPAVRVETRRLLAQLHDRLPTTTCYVTHDQAEALSLGQRVAVMHAGRIEQVGTPRQIYDRPANRFVAGFIGSPPMAFLPGRLVESQGQWRLEGCGWQVPVPAGVALPIAQLAAGELLLGLRAEHVRLAGDLSASAGSVPARVVRTELLGGEQLVQLQVDRNAAGHEASAFEPSATAGRDSASHPAAAGCVWMKVPAASAIDGGDEIRVEFDVRRAGWFAAADGRNLQTEPVARR